MRRGEIWHVDLDPTTGQEKRGRRPVLIVSPDEFNRLAGMAIIVPITMGGVSARHKGFAVSLTAAGTSTGGVVLCNQIRTVDLGARKGTRSETVPKFILDEVLARIAPFFE